MKNILKLIYRERNIITILAVMLLACISYTDKVNACDDACFAAGGSNASTSQSQSTYNELTQAPTLSMSGSNSNSIVNASANISNSFAVSADGGLSGGRTCAADTVAVSVSAGGNEQNVHHSRYGSHSVNGQVTLQYVKMIGEAQDNCLEGQRMDIRLQKLAASSYLIRQCLTFMNSGIDVNVLAQIDKNYVLCPKVMGQAIQGYHGRIGEQAVAEYRRKREANMRAVGVDPAKEHVVYYK